MECVKHSIFFVTGTDTGVGKTTLTCLLTRDLRVAGISVAALKPVASGGRADAKALHTALGGALTLDEINPWHFRAPIAPLLAARLDRRRVTLARVVAHVRRFRKLFQVVVVEGAGGLLSPLGDPFDSRDLLVALRAVPLVVCPNRLGAVNQARLVLDALPERFSRRARVVLMPLRESDSVRRSNRLLLAEMLGEERVHVFPAVDDWKTEVSLVRARPFFRRLWASLPIEGGPADNPDTR